MPLDKYANEILQKGWNLKTHPFCPTEYPDGAPIATEVFQGPLDSRKDTRLIRFYFDLYDWGAEEILGEISEQVILKRFPAAAQRLDPECLLFLISGAQRSGKHSLSNLILHKIEYEHHEPVLEFNVPLDSTNAATTVKTVARAFIDEYVKHNNQPTEDTFWKIYDREIKEGDVGESSAYSNLFQRLKGKLPANFKRPIVPVVTGADHWDTWQLIYNSTKYLCDYIMVHTHRTDYANAAYVAMKNSKSVAWVKAMDLGEDELHNYLISRLGKERLHQANHEDIHPFSKEAIRVLFARTRKKSRSGTRRRRRHKVGQEETVRREIGWINETLRRAMDEHIAVLSGILEKGKLQVKDCNPDAFLIDADILLRIRDEYLNWGR